MRFLSGIIFIFALTFALIACSESDDGPMPMSSSPHVYSGKGFFRLATLDSGKSIHISDDTLYVQLDSLWTFSNCGLKNIWMEHHRDGSTLVLKPHIEIETSNEDCASPLFRPETTLSILLGNVTLGGVERIFIKNDLDSLLDSILVKRGKMSLDTFKIFVDSLFDSVHALPVRTKGSPSILRVLDSLTPRTFLWRTMKSECTLRIDMCSKVVADTIYPRAWSLTDTNLVPVHYACADSDSVYCHSARWKDDSTSLGALKQRPDTVWHTSTYFMEKIPECGSLDGLDRLSGFLLGKEVVISRDLFSPSSVESTCGPSTAKGWYAFDLNRNFRVPDTIDVESLYKAWNKARVAREKQN